MKPYDVIKTVDESMNLLLMTTINFVAEYQKEKGFINTENKDNKNDTIWAITLCSGGEFVEYQVKAVKVVNGSLMALIDNYSILYTDEDIKEDPCDCWSLVKDDDYVYFYPTLYSIACSISQYVDC